MLDSAKCYDSLAPAPAAVIVALPGQSAQNPLPNREMRDPDGQTVQFRFRTLPHSVQVYTCKPATSGGFAWTGPDPDAILINDAKTLTIHHYKGPTWEATDGSMVQADSSRAAHFLPKDPEAVHWLELPVREATKQFAGVTFIHRIDTSGGRPVADSPCDAAHAGDQQRVDYSATYLFYAAR